MTLLTWTWFSRSLLGSMSPQLADRVLLEMGSHSADIFMLLSCYLECWKLLAPRTFTI